MSILKDIAEKKRESLIITKGRVSLRDLKSFICDIDKPMDFSTAIKRYADGNIKLIAEIKRASPSRGIIRTDFDHLSIARIYEKKAISAVSILTEEDFFLGNLTFIREVRNILTKPFGIYILPRAARYI